MTLFIPLMSIFIRALTLLLRTQPSWPGNKGPTFRYHKMGIKVSGCEFWDYMNIQSIVNSLFVSKFLRPFGLLVLLPSVAQHHPMMLFLKPDFKSITYDLAWLNWTDAIISLIYMIFQIYSSQISTTRGLSVQSWFAQSDYILTSVLLAISRVDSWGCKKEAFRSGDNL